MKKAVKPLVKKDVNLLANYLVKIVKVDVKLLVRSLVKIVIKHVNILAVGKIVNLVLSFATVPILVWIIAKSFVSLVLKTANVLILAWDAMAVLGDVKCLVKMAVK